MRLLTIYISFSCLVDFEPYWIKNSKATLISRIIKPMAITIQKACHNSLYQ